LFIDEKSHNLLVNGQKIDVTLLSMDENSEPMCLFLKKKEKKEGYG
jgi:hypothetical protein